MESDILKRFDSIRIFSKDGKLASHKPLLLLYTLSELKNENTERIGYNDAEKAVGPLIETYGPFGTKANVSYPFARLENEKCEIWSVEDAPRNSAGGIYIKDARKQNLKAGFSSEVLTALRKNPKLIDLVAINLLERNFPPSLHLDILEAVGLFLGQEEIEAVNRKKRVPNFRDRVLTAYFAQCAFCKFDAKMNGRSVALEAVHIKMHPVGGADSTPNGLALCTMHHKLFDLGVLTINETMRVQVSQRVVGEWGRRLNDELQSKPMIQPREKSMSPDPKYIAWHNEKIFKGKVG